MVALTGAVVALIVAALGRSDGERGGSGARDLLAPGDPGPLHVHGLGINPADQALFIATHTGMYRLPPDATRAERWMAQVHASRTSGRSWTAVRDAGGQPATFLAETPQSLYVALHDGTVQHSADGGRSWTVRSTPG